MSGDGELRAIAERYARRGAADRYSLARPDVMHALQERQRALRALLEGAGLTDFAALRLLEVGCGTGGNLQELLWLGFRPENLCGAELLEDRLAHARTRLPAALALHGGDATQLVLPPQSQDIVYASTVFSSLLDDAVQQHLADAMWRWVRPGGGVLWYDFTVDNPRNPDVRGVPLTRVRQLFPHGSFAVKRLTLAPPLARRAVALHPSLYTVLNAVPWLRTHVLAWIAKPR
jgi:SAM-dependent methyltransferase